MVAARESDSSHTVRRLDVKRRRSTDPVCWRAPIVVRSAVTVPGIVFRGNNLAAGQPGCPRAKSVELNRVQENETRIGSHENLVVGAADASGSSPIADGQQTPRA